MKKNVICIVSGPTATGKTSISIQLAKKFGGEIVNFDSLVFYKELNIGTAKPTTDEMQGVPHHLVGTHSIGKAINAADFMKEALPVIQNIHARNQIAYLVGGSGFYLQALLYGMYESSTTPAEIQTRSDELYHQLGIEPFIAELQQYDPESLAKYHPNDHYRIRRAVEHFWTTGQKFSLSRNQMDQKSDQAPWIKHNWNVFHAYLDIPKEQHFQLILERSARMVHSGLIDEVKRLLHLGFTGHEKPLQSIGHKETLEYLDGRIGSLNELIEKISIATRQLAKAQRTWFKKQEKRSYNALVDQDQLFKDFQQYIQDPEV